MTKVCSCCKIEKPKSEYGKDRQKKDGLQYYCKACKKVKSVGSRLKSRYDLSIEEFHTTWSAQDGRCAICSRGLELRTGGYATDHNHTTGYVRGLLCMPCNSAIGLLQDDPAIIKQAAAYLEQRGSYHDPVGG